MHFSSHVVPGTNPFSFSLQGVRITACDWGWASCTINTELCFGCGRPASQAGAYVHTWPTVKGLYLTGGPEAQPRPHATGELNKASRKPRALRVYQKWTFSQPSAGTQPPADCSKAQAQAESPLLVRMKQTLHKTAVPLPGTWGSTALVDCSPHLAVPIRPLRLGWAGERNHGLLFRWILVKCSTNWGTGFDIH